MEVLGYCPDCTWTASSEEGVEHQGDVELVVEGEGGVRLRGG